MLYRLRDTYELTCVTIERERGGLRHDSGEWNFDMGKQSESQERAQQDLLDIIALPMGNFYSIVCWTVRSHGGDSPLLLWRPFHLHPNTRGTVGCVVCCVWPGSINDAQEEVNVEGVDLKNETGRRSVLFSLDPPGNRPEAIEWLLIFFRVTGRKKEIKIG
jgi:hypothetical protein